MKLIALVAFALFATGCLPAFLRSKGPYTIVQDQREAASSEPDVAQVTQREWSVSRARLSRLRKAQPDRPYTERVRVAIVDPRNDKAYEARGAVAVNPGRAARMMLVGPGGTTALDVWVTPEKFRFAVPAMQLEKRGGTSHEETRGLPIGLLRWWFLDPLGGKLLVGRSTDEETAWLLREGEATVTVRTDGERFRAVRRAYGHMEGIDWLARGLVPHPGARGRYIESTFGLRVEVIVEDVLGEEPDPAAFVDPDDEGTAL